MAQNLNSEISVTRNISKIDEMRLETGGFIIRGEVDVVAGTVRKIDNGTASDLESGMFLGGFNVQGLTSVSVSIQNAYTRQERQAVYEAVETFLESVIDSVTPKTEQP